MGSELLNDRIRAGEEYNGVRIEMDSTAEQVQEIIRTQSPDIIYVDSQHGRTPNGTSFESANPPRSWGWV